MHTKISRRTASNVRAALAVVAFTVLAAVGFATGQRVERATAAQMRPAVSATPSTTPTGARQGPSLASPSAAPMHAGVFHGRF